MPTSYIALGLSVVALLWQAYTFHRNTRLALYQHRFAVYNSLQALFRVFYKNHEFEQADVTAFRHATDHANFLFGPEITSHLNSIVGAAVHLTADLKELRFYQSGGENIGEPSDSVKKEIAMLEDRVRTARVRLCSSQYPPSQ